MNDLLPPLGGRAILVALGVLWLPPLVMALRSPRRFLHRPRPDYTPAVALVVEPVGMAAYLASALTRKLSWRGITYEFVSAEETLVLPLEEAAQPWERPELAHVATSVRALPMHAQRLATVALGGRS